MDPSVQPAEVRSVGRYFGEEESSPYPPLFFFKYEGSAITEPSMLRKRMGAWGKFSSPIISLLTNVTANRRAIFQYCCLTEEGNTESSHKLRTIAFIQVPDQCVIGTADLYKE